MEEKKSYKYCVKIYDGSESTFDRDIYVLEKSYYSRKENDYVRRFIGFVDKDFLDYFKGIVFDNRKNVK